MSRDAVTAAGSETWGRLASGEAVSRTSIGAGALSANILSWGAVIQDLRLDGHDAPLVLGYRDFAPYEENPPYFGTVAGRFANRIADGRFTIDGERFETPRNFLGRHSLHGGPVGFAHRNWTVTATEAASIKLAWRDPDGEAGFPGNLDVTLTYELAPPATLRMTFEATTDQPTLCNLAQHSYFNLDDGGASDIFGHRLQIDAGAFLPVDDGLIPTGTVELVDNGPFDFRAARPIGADGETEFDHNFCLAAAPGALKRAAWTQGARSGVEMELWTTEPGLQFYTGHHIKGEGLGLLGRPYRPFTGFCLEAQTWPDSPHRPYFPQALLRPGETYRQVTEWRFRLG